LAAGRGAKGGPPHTPSAGPAGVGSAGHLGGVYFQKVTGTRFPFVPYRGTGPGAAALGELQMAGVDKWWPIIKAANVRGE